MAHSPELKGEKTCPGGSYIGSSSGLWRNIKMDRRLPRTTVEDLLSYHEELDEAQQRKQEMKESNEKAKEAALSSAHQILEIEEGLFHNKAWLFHNMAAGELRGYLTNGRAVIATIKDGTITHIQYMVGF
jgi:hypothetical protein